MIKEMVQVLCDDQKIRSGGYTDDQKTSGN